MFAVVNVPVDAVVTPIEVPLIAPPVMATEDDAKLLAVTNPVPKVTGLLVTVLMDRVPAVASSTGDAAVREILPEEVTWNWDDEPTENKELGEAVPIPTCPPVATNVPSCKLYVFEMTNI